MKKVCIFALVFGCCYLNSLAQSFPICWETPYPNGVMEDKGNYTINQTGTLLSTERVNANDGYVEVLLQSDLTDESFWIGLTDRANPTDWKDFTYSIGVDAFGSPESKHAYHFGTWKAGFSAVQRGDRLRIAITNGQAVFSINGTSFYQMNVTHTTDLQAVVYFNVVQNRTYQTTLDIVSSTDCDGTPPSTLLNAQLTATNADFEQNNGRVTAQITSGTPPYQIEWSNGEVVTNTEATTHILDNLAPGTYGVVITDATGQGVIPDEVVVGENPSNQFAIQMSKTDVTYPNGNDGTVTAEIINANPPFRIEWSRGDVINGTYLTTQKIYGLPQGDYQVTVTDGDQRTVVSEVIRVNDPGNMPELDITLTAQNVEFGDDGRATVTINDGQPPYQVEWSTGEEITGGFATEYTIFGLSAGNYAVTVSDNTGQNGTAEILVGDDRGFDLQVMLSRTDESAANANDGTVTANVTGGIAPYDVNWSTGAAVQNSNETVHILQNLSPGSYSVTITDEANEQVSAGPIVVNDYQEANCGTTQLSDCSNAQPNVDTSLGEPQNITLPTEVQAVYSGGREIPTFREMFGTNIIITNTFDYPGMQNLTDIFSYPRVFLFNNKDYWDDGIGEPTTENKKRIIRPREIERLKVLVDENGAPFLRGSFVPGDRIISIDPNSGDFVETPITPQNYSDYSAEQQNTYTGYMNSNFRFIQEHYQKWISEQNNNPRHPYQFKGLAVTLTVVNANFPSSIAADYNFPANWWKAEDWGFNLGQIKCSAKAYAKIFARTYAPTAADCADCERLVEVLEIGNECWAYDAPTYHAIVEGFLEGFAEYYQTDQTNKIRLIPAAFQAQHLENNVPANAGSSASWKDYLGTRIPSEYKCFLDGVNLHPYSNQLSDNGSFFTQRLLAYPERLQANGNADSKFLYTKNAWKWVEDNLPLSNRNMHITEFGWDSENNDCGNGSRVGVGEFTQGLYIIRSLLNMSRMGVYRATLFEASDDPQLHNTCQFAYHSSGLWGVDPASGGAPKLSQKMLLKFMEVAGDKHFHSLVSENDQGAYAYFLEGTNGVSHVVTWYAVDVNNQTRNQAESQVFNTALNLQIGQQNYAVDFNQDWHYLDDQVTVGSDGKVATTSALNTTEKDKVYQNGNFSLTPIPVLIPVTLTNPCTDATVPELQCPADIAQPQTDTETPVFFANPTVTDDCDPQPNLTATHASGDAFPVGTTLVTFTATDASGKQGTCSFNITIQPDNCNDTERPQIDCPEDITVPQDGELTTVNWTPPTPTDDCDPNPTLSSSHQPGDGFPVGSTTVNCNVVDAAGKGNSCAFTVTVEAENTGEPVEYCQVQTQQPWERWIQRVQLNQLDNSSGKQASPPVGYGDFTQLSTALMNQTTYDLNLTPGYSWAADPNHNMHWRVWIDWNQDGDFDDSGEAIVQAQSNREVTVSIGVPAFAKLGATRMRISFKNNGYPAACETFDQGEIEDYTIMVTSSS